MSEHGLRFGRIAAGIGTNDMERAIAFYTEVLGFSVVFQNGDPVIFTILERDAAELHLLYAAGFRGPAINVAHMFVDDVNALHTHCMENSVTIVKAIADKDYGMRAFVIEDPDGNRIDIGQPD